MKISAKNTQIPMSIERFSNSESTWDRDPLISRFEWFILNIPDYPPISEFIHIIVFCLIGKLTFLLYFVIVCSLYFIIIVFALRSG